MIITTNGRLRLKCRSGWPRGADVTFRITDVFGIGLSIILEHMQYSFQNVKQKKKKDKENILQDEFNNAKQNFECDPTNKNASECTERKIRTFL